MITLQIPVDEETYLKLLKLKGTKRSWAQFLKEELLDEL